jgi:hypothetical protein
MSGHHRPFRVPSPAAGRSCIPVHPNVLTCQRGRGVRKEMLRARRSRFAYPTPDHSVRQARGGKRIKLGPQAPRWRSPWLATATGLVLGYRRDLSHGTAECHRLPSYLEPSALRLRLSRPISSSSTAYCSDSLTNSSLLILRALKRNQCAAREGGISYGDSLSAPQQLGHRHPPKWHSFCERQVGAHRRNPRSSKRVPSDAPGHRLRGGMR